MITEEPTEPQVYRGRSGRSAGSHRRLFAAGGVSAILLVGGMVLALSAGGGTRKATIAPSLAASQSTTTTAPAAAAVETFQAFATKDPFSPLASDASSAGSPTTTPGGAGAAAPAAPGGTHVALLDVFTDGDHAAARVRVNDTIFEKLAVGQTFAGNLKVISLSQSSDCGSFLYGDDQFRLCKGQEVVK